MVIRGGAIPAVALDNGVKQLANIPSREVLLAQLCLLMSRSLVPPVVLAALASKRWRSPEAALPRPGFAERERLGTSSQNF